MNCSTLGAKNKMWRALVSDAKSRNSYIRASDVPALANVVNEQTTLARQMRRLLSAQDPKSSSGNQEVFERLLWRMQLSIGVREALKSVREEEKQRIMEMLVQCGNGLGHKFHKGKGTDVCDGIIHERRVFKLRLVW